MRILFNDLQAQYFDLRADIDNAIKNTISSSAFVRGDEVKLFEQEFAKNTENKFCISCANGSDALFIALKALNLKPGDEVITTSFSWIATSAAITMAGGNVKFCDIEDGTFNLDTKLIEKKITKKTVGIIPVHLYGIPAKMENIKKKI